MANPATARRKSGESHTPLSLASAGLWPLRRISDDRRRSWAVRSTSPQDAVRTRRRAFRLIEICSSVSSFGRICMTSKAAGRRHPRRRHRRRRDGGDARDGIAAARARIGGFALDYRRYRRRRRILRGHRPETWRPGGEEAAGAADAIYLGAIGLPSIRHDGRHGDLAASAPAGALSALRRHASGQSLSERAGAAR